MTKFARDSLKLDKGKIIVDNKRYLKVSAVISKAGVYDYPDGAAFKTRDELLKATRTALFGCQLTLRKHPDTLIIMSQNDIYGGVEKPYFDNDKIRAVLAFDKKFTPEGFLQKVRLAMSGVGEPLDNSIGFHYRPDFTPGKAKDVNTGKMRPYDYVMRDIVIDHVAVGNFVGRCTAPSCGVGVDATLRRIGLDPFGQYKGMTECIAANKDKKNPAAFCAWLHKKITGKYPGQSSQDAVLYSLIGDITELDQSPYGLIFGDMPRPSKKWMKQARDKANVFAEDSAGFCGWLWHYGPENLKKEFGLSSKKVETKLSETETETEYEKCIREKKAEGMSDEEAKEACASKKTDQEEQSAYVKCISDKKAEGMTQEEAESACEALKPAAEAQEGEKTPWQLCIQKHMAEGLDKEQARMKCKEEGVTKAGAQELSPWQACIKEEMAKPDATMEKAVAACKAKGLGKPAEDQEPAEEPAEENKLEACIRKRMEETEDDREAAKIWCEAEAAGEHETVSDIATNIQRLRDKRQRLNQ